MIEQLESAGSAPLSVSGLATRSTGPVRSVGLLTRPLAGRAWDPVLYWCGGSGALGLAIILAIPALTEAVVFISVIFYTNGVFATFLPSASEPAIMAMGKLHPAWFVALVAMPGVALAEVVNYKLFDVVLHAPRLTSVRDARMMRWATATFNVQPFLTVAAAAFTPIPFWMARACAVVAGYPFWRFVVATLLGRFPRICLIAFIGSAVPLTSPQLIAVGAGFVVILAVIAACQRRRQCTPRS